MAETSASNQQTAQRLLRWLVMFCRDGQVSQEQAMAQWPDLPPERWVKDIHLLRASGCPIEVNSRHTGRTYSWRQPLWPVELSPALAKDFCQTVERLMSKLSPGTLHALREITAQWPLAQQPDWSLHSLQETSLAVSSHDSVGEWPLEHWQQVCQNRQQVLLTVHAPQEGQPVQHLLVEPHQVLQTPLPVSLLGYVPDWQESGRWPLSSIQSLDVLPTRCRHQVELTRVQFCLTGRLATNYRLYPDEQIVSHANNQLVVEAWPPHWPSLIYRLLKYGTYCHILSPHKAKEYAHAYLRRQLAALSPVNEAPVIPLDSEDPASQTAPIQKADIP